MLTAGRADEFDLFAPTAQYADALQAAGVDVVWLPTPLGHFGQDDQRWGPMAKIIMRQLASP